MLASSIMGCDERLRGSVIPENEQPLSPGIPQYGDARSLRIYHGTYALAVSCVTPGDMARVQRQVGGIQQCPEAATGLGECHCPDARRRTHPSAMKLVDGSAFS